MKIRELVFIILLIPFNSNCQENIEWITHFGGSSYDISKDILTDKQGNIYIAGAFTRKIVIFPLKIISNGETDVFLAKLNPSGKVLWIRNFGGRSWDNCGGICMDKNSNVYLTGTFKGDMIIENNIFSGNSTSNIFLTKIDKNGDVIWAKAFGKFLWAVGGGGTGWSEGNSIVVDNSGDILLNGWFRKDLYFISDFVAVGGNNNGPDNIFIAKFDEQGKIKWIQTGRCNKLSNSYSLAVNNEDEIFLTGFFRGLIEIDDYRYDFNNFRRNIYILKLDKEGKCLWLKTYGGDSPTDNSGYSLIHSNNNLYLTGIYSTNSWWGSNWVQCIGYCDIFVVKLSNAVTNIPAFKDEVIYIYPNTCSGILQVGINNQITGSVFKVKIRMLRYFFSDQEPEEMTEEILIGIFWLLLQGIT